MLITALVKWRPVEEGSVLAEAKEVHPNCRGGRGVSAHSSHISRGFRSVGRAAMPDMSHMATVTSPSLCVPTGNKQQLQTISASRHGAAEEGVERILVAAKG